jgi:predicted Rossmann fold nucleotide-binding protein DprA/Smf involved in DNA uptake
VYTVYFVSAEGAAGSVDLSRLLARDYWLILSTPALGADRTAGDPFVRAGLRTFAVYRWRLNEGCVGVRLSLGTGTYEWR